MAPGQRGDRDVSAPSSITWGCTCGADFETLDELLEHAATCDG